MAGKLVTEASRRTVNWLANMNKIALQSATLRENKFYLDKNENEYYHTIALYDTDQHMVLAPFNNSSTSPVYIVFAGTHTASMLTEALELAQINQANTPGYSYDDYPSFITAKNLVSSVKADANLFGVNRELIVTGFSLGGIKAIYSHYHQSNIIDKTIVFNPWVGEWNSGISFDPKEHLNLWHDERLVELHGLSDSPVPSGFKKLYVNYIRGEFASKYWQAQSEFPVAWSSEPKTLALGWGINFKYPQTYAHNNLPEDLADYLVHSTQTGYDHAINNWVYDLVNESVPPNQLGYIFGSKIITNAKGYEFPNHDPTGSLHNFFWCAIGNTPQLNLVDDLSIQNKDNFKWDFNPQDLNGNNKIQPAQGNLALFNLIYQIEYVKTESSKNYYLIRNSNGDYAHFPSTSITSSFRNANDPAHLGIEWKNQAQYSATSIRTHYWWVIEDASALTEEGPRRILDPDDYDTMGLLKQNGTTEFIIQQPDVPGFYMEQQDIPTADDYASIMQLGSLAQLSNSSGIKWSIIYNATDNTYQFRNILDNSIYLGLNNIWYVTGAGPIHMNLITNTNVILEPTGEPDEYYIKQAIPPGVYPTSIYPNGVTVTMARVTHTHDNATDVTGAYTSWSMTWYEFPDLSRSKFIIRPYDELLDVGNVNFIIT